MNLNQKLEEMYKEIGKSAMEVTQYDSSIYGMKVFCEEYGFTIEQAKEAIQNYKEMKEAQDQRYTEEGQNAFEENTDPKYAILKKIRYTRNKYIDGIKSQAITKILKQIKSEEIDESLIEQLDDTGCDVKQILNELLNDNTYLFGKDELRSSLEKVQTMYNDFEKQKSISEEKNVVQTKSEPKQRNFFSRLFEKVKKIFGKNKTKMLPERAENKQVDEDTQRKSYAEELQVKTSTPVPARENGNEKSDERLSNLKPERQNNDDLEL